MAQTPLRDQKTEATRSRIAEAGLELFVQQGYAETSIDQIADAAGVGRRTVFRHFETKEAILFDHFVVRRDLAVQQLHERPSAEAPLVSLHAVLRLLSQKGYDRRLLAQIRTVLATEPQLLGTDLARRVQSFERGLIVAVESRTPQLPKAEIRALTLMTLSWLDAAIRTYLLDNRPSLVECFDEAVVACLRATARDLTPTLPTAPSDGQALG